MHPADLVAWAFFAALGILILTLPIGLLLVVIQGTRHVGPDSTPTPSNHLSAVK